MVRSRLTNEWVDADVAATRPIAVMIPNEAAAIPQYSLSEASILYEANVENRMTRMMAVYEGWEDLDKIGNIRSMRDYYAGSMVVSQSCSASISPNPLYR